MFVLEENKDVEVIEFDSLKSITEDEIEELNSLTNRIPINTEGTVSTVSTKEDGTSVTTTQGKIEITDDEGYTYKYELIEILDKNETVTTPNEVAVELYNELTTLQNADTMYEKLVSEIKIRDDFNTLIQNATWQVAEDRTILQPEDSQEGEKFIVLIQKIKSGVVETEDLQIMTCAREDEADVEYTNTVVTTVVEKKTALPVTGENLILYIAFGIIILAIIAVIVRMNSLKGKHHGKH